MSTAPVRRHIQDFNNASNLEPHWGYADRVVPCTNDAGSCAYLDLVYWAHDVGMIYVGAAWALIGGLVLIWAFAHRSHLSSSRLPRTLSALKRKYLLTEFRAGRWLFGRTTRLQVVVLGIIVAYLTVFSFCGLYYQTWVTPVKNMPGVYNTRTTLGPWADRIGVWAYALTPLSILLAQRESLLAQLTGIPYHHFNFLHRWLGHIIFAQSLLHTIGWVVVEVKLYQPQPTVAVAWIKQPYIIWGCVAMIVLFIMWGLALPVSQRLFGYEFFRKAHWVLAMVFIGGCIGHWKQLECFMIPSILLWVVDRAARLIRTGLIHYRITPEGKGMFASIPARVTHFGDDVVRLDLDDPNPAASEWLVGQHFYLTFAAGSIWQSHPFTPLALPGTRQSYIVRAKRGESKKLVQFQTDTTPVILTGPYGQNVLSDVDANTNVLAIAGGTGISFVLPVLLRLALTPGQARIKLVWIVRHAADRDWIAAELDVLAKSANNIQVVVHTTRQPEKVAPEYSRTTTGDSNGDSADATPSGSCCCKAETPASAEKETNEDKDAEAGSGGQYHHRPDVHEAIESFVAGCIGQTNVYVSGPSGVITAARESVAKLSDPGNVWRGQGGDVRLIYDERLE